MQNLRITKLSTDSLTTDLKAQAKQRFNEYDEIYGRGYNGGWDTGTLIIDAILWIAGLITFAITAPKVLTLIPCAALIALIIQVAKRSKTGRVSKPIVFGPVTLVCYRSIQRQLIESLEKRMNRCLDRSYSDSDKRKKELYKLTKNVINGPGQINQSQMLFWMLNADQELRFSEQKVAKAISDTKDAVSKLGYLKETLAITELVEALKVQQAKLEKREEELKATRDSLVQEMTGTTEKFAALDQARTALDSLKLFATNKELLRATELAVESARSLCVDWSGKIAALELDTKALIHTLPEASEIYEITA